MNPMFVVSLDFELFWGVADSRTIGGYRGNIEGEWEAIPRLLDLFRRYEIRVSWATVGMLMCRDYSQWREIRPTDMPSYARTHCSNYSLDLVVRQNPKLFFARPLVEQILEVPGQEIASHSYSHFYCNEEGVTSTQFAADLACAKLIAKEVGIEYKSFVFPRNQVNIAYLEELCKAGYKVFRGTPKHWLYTHGHTVALGDVGRGIRLADAYVSISGNHIFNPTTVCGLINVPASLSLRPWSRRFPTLEKARLMRVRHAMTEAALSSGIFHLWWHPHNFGVNIDENLAVLESLLQHFVVLRDKYGMSSLRMGDFITKEFS